MTTMTLDRPDGLLRARAAKAAEDHTMPAKYIRRILAGDPVVRVYREYRGFTVQQLAEVSGVEHTHIERVETGRGHLASDAVNMLAAALAVSADLLI